MKKVLNSIRELINHPSLVWMKNRYVLSGVLFLIWMLFLDTHSLKIHYKLYKEIQQTRRAIDFYKSEIEKDKKLIQQLESNPDMLERFAREQYYFKKPNEAIFIVELNE
ncbi:MAG: FtsB family cell division protein [Thermaurantimonas sp.]|uniref:FtsB family cell division protein n=1 Tax=Thermaurantimonas sp. TaxID=2681568 RepID=UPI00391BF50E